MKMLELVEWGSELLFMPAQEVEVLDHLELKHPLGFVVIGLEVIEV
jgi:hypothetical protein